MIVVGGLLRMFELSQPQRFLPGGSVPSRVQLAPGVGRPEHHHVFDRLVIYVPAAPHAKNETLAESD